MLRIAWLALLLVCVAAKKVEPPPVATKDVKPEAEAKPRFAVLPAAEDDCVSYPCIVFEDDFNTLNFQNWQHEITAGGGGNWEFEYYTNNRSNSYVRDGILYIKPTLTDDSFYPGFVSSGTLDLWGHQPPNHCTGHAWWGCERVGTATNYINPIQSARLRSAHEFSVQYGRIEIRARMPRGDWIWPALWLLPRYNEYGDWPHSGEMDVFESRGNDLLFDSQGTNVGNPHGGCTMHWGAHGGGNKYYLTTGSVNHPNSTFADEFVDYIVDWDENGLVFTVGGQEVLRVEPDDTGFWGLGNYENELPPENNPWVGGSKMAPFDKPFYMVMNVAVGGTNGYFDDSHTNGNGDKPWSNTSPTAPQEFWDGRDQWLPTWNGEDVAMAIDHIRVIKMQANSGTTKA